jgi:hypothetical protein
MSQIGSPTGGPTRFFFSDPFQQGLRDPDCHCPIVLPVGQWWWFVSLGLTSCLACLQGGIRSRALCSFLFVVECAVLGHCLALGGCCWRLHQDVLNCLLFPLPVLVGFLLGRLHVSKFLLNCLKIGVLSIKISKVCWLHDSTGVMNPLLQYYDGVNTLWYTCALIYSSTTITHMVKRRRVGVRMRWDRKYSKNKQQKLTSEPDFDLAF